MNENEARAIAGITQLSDFERLARNRLPDHIWHYLEAGAGEQKTLRANRDAFISMPLIPRPLADVRGGNTRLTLFGQSFEHPILVAPIAYQRLFHPEGECATALAASSQGSTMIVSTLASQPFSKVVAAAHEGGATPWFQLYWQKDRDSTLKLIRRAESAGFGAVIFTVDAPVKESWFTLPQGVEAVNLDTYPCPPPGQSAVFHGWMAIAPTWSDLRWLRDQVRMPLLLKGILHPEDAERAAALGCDGIIVSNHGGRVLDGVPASLDQLPKVVERVGYRIPVLFDSGVRDGCDVFRALVLGARAVLVGRPVMWGLAVGGAFGVAKVLRLLRDGLELTMALCGHAVLPSNNSTATQRKTQ